MYKLKTDYTLAEVVNNADGTESHTMQVPALMSVAITVMLAGRYGTVWGKSKALRDAWGHEGCELFVREWLENEGMMPEGFCPLCGELNPKWEPILESEFMADGSPDVTLHPCCRCGEEKP